MSQLPSNTPAQSKPEQVGESDTEIMINLLRQKRPERYSGWSDENMEALVRLFSTAIENVVNGIPEPIDN
jgi:hypothetical protein